jgi:hypothetical protein
VRYVRPIWLFVPLLAIACASIPGISPSSSGAGSTLAPTTSPAEVVPTVSTEPVGSVADSPQPSTTPKPRKTPKPTSPATPTPPPISVDLSIYVQTADIPNPWYAETTYTIPIHVAVAVADVPNAHVKVLTFDDTEFDTGPIATTDTYAHDTDVTFYFPGPNDLVLSVKAPAGYADIYKSNNKVVIHIDVQPKP